MRLCYVAPFESIHTMRWLDYFSRDHEVHLISVCRGDVSKYHDEVMFYLNKGINLHLIKSKSNVSPKAVYKIIQRIYKIQPDLVHGFYLTNYAFAAALSMYRPFVASAWGSDVLVDPEKNIVFKLCSLFALHRADLVTCDGNDILKTIQSKCLWPKKMVKICHGVDVNQFKVVENGEREMVVIYTRGFREVYDPMTLVDVIAAVVKDYPDVKFLLLGEGSLKEEVMEKIAQNGCAENVEFLGQVNYVKMPEIYARGKVYLSTSLSDAGMANGTVEAMACGLPVVVTDSGDHDDLLVPFVHGFVAPKRCPELLAKGVSWYLRRSKVQLDHIGNRNHAFVEQFGNYEKEMNDMDAHYRMLVEKVNQ